MIILDIRSLLVRCNGTLFFFVAEKRIQLNVHMLACRVLKAGTIRDSSALPKDVRIGLVGFVGC
ncbi:hypothetical protein LguiA_003473 [Lonicera macranthoides]